MRCCPGNSGAADGRVSRARGAAAPAEPLAREGAARARDAAGGDAARRVAARRPPPPLRGHHGRPARAGEPAQTPALNPDPNRLHFEGMMADLREQALLRHICQCLYPFPVGAYVPPPPRACAGPRGGPRPLGAAHRAVPGRPRRQWRVSPPPTPLSVASFDPALPPLASPHLLLLLLSPWLPASLRFHDLARPPMYLFLTFSAPFPHRLCTRCS